MTVAGQPTITYAYDTADRLTSITQGTAVVTFGYDNANRRTALTLPSGVTTTYAYDAASRLTGLLPTQIDKITRLAPRANRELAGAAMQTFIGPTA